MSRRLYWQAVGQAMRVAGVHMSAPTLALAREWAAAHPNEVAVEVRNLKDQYLMDDEAVSKFSAREAAATQHCN